MQNLKGILEAAGTSFSNVIKTSIFLMDMGKFADVNSIYGKYFDEATAPARETVQVSGLPKGVQVDEGASGAGPGEPVGRPASQPTEDQCAAQECERQGRSEACE